MDFAETGARGEVSYELSIAQAERRKHGLVGPDMPGGRLLQDTVPGSVLHRAEDRDREATGRAEDAVHLPKCSQLVRKELKALLTDHGFEGSIGERHVVRASLKPLDLQPLRRHARCSEHPRIQIETYDPAVGGYPLVEQARDDARPAGDV